MTARTRTEERGRRTGRSSTAIRRDEKRYGRTGREKIPARGWKRSTGDGKKNLGLLCHLRLGRDRVRRCRALRGDRSLYSTGFRWARLARRARLGSSYSPPSTSPRGCRYCLPSLSCSHSRADALIHTLLSRADSALHKTTQNRCTGRTVIHTLGGERGNGAVRPLTSSRYRDSGRDPWAKKGRRNKRRDGSRLNRLCLRGDCRQRADGGTDGRTEKTPGLGVQLEGTQRGGERACCDCVSEGGTRRRGTRGPKRGEGGGGWGEEGHCTPGCPLPSDRRIAAAVPVYCTTELLFSARCPSGSPGTLQCEGMRARRGLPAKHAGNAPDATPRDDTLRSRGGQIPPSAHSLSHPGKREREGGNEKASRVLRSSSSRPPWSQQSRIYPLVRAKEGKVLEDKEAHCRAISEGLCFLLITLM